MSERLWNIDGYPVSEQEVLEQATMIRGNDVRSLGLALRILREDGREVSSRSDAATCTRSHRP